MPARGGGAGARSSLAAILPVSPASNGRCRGSQCGGCLGERQRAISATSGSEARLAAPSPNDKGASTYSDGKVANRELGFGTS